jgi:hypothetical protein
MGKGSCPVCQEQAKAEVRGDEKASQELKPTRRVLVWMLDKKETDPTKQDPLLWAIPASVDKNITMICKDRESGEFYPIDHPDSGLDVYFDKHGEGLTTKYEGFQLSKRPSQVEQKHLDYISANPVTTTINWRTYEEVKAIMGGEIGPAEPVAPQPSSPGFQTPLASAALASPQPVAPTPAVIATPESSPFQSRWLESFCTVCNNQQYTTPNSKTCANGHEGDVGYLKAAPALPPPPPSQATVVATPPPPPAVPTVVTPPPPPPGQSPSAAKADLLKQRFTTGS